MVRSTLVVNSHSGKYPVVIQRDLTKEIASALSHIGLGSAEWSNIVFIADDNTRVIASRLIAQLNLSEDSILTILPGEASKSLVNAHELWQRLLLHPSRRNLVIIALGGGVIGDLCGFVAGTIFRGVRLVHVPTTLIAQVDSTIGGKVAINLPSAKNAVGLHYSPRGVLIDPALLATLPAGELKSGLAEVIKIGLLFDGELYNEAIKITSDGSPAIDPLIERAVQLKIKVVEVDEFERNGRRILLNLGHTIGHAIEAGCNFKGITHGQAVAWGILGEHLFLENKTLVNRLKSDWKKLGLISTLPGYYDRDLAAGALQFDKKGLNDTLSLPHIKEIGNGETVEVRRRDLAQFIESDWLKELL